MGIQDLEGWFFGQLRLIYFLVVSSRFLVMMIPVELEEAWFLDCRMCGWAFRTSRVSLLINQDCFGFLL